MPSSASTTPRSQTNARALPQVRDARWYERAACKGAEPRKFELPNDDSPGKRIRNAVGNAITGYCFGCPVRRDCLVDAMQRHDVGVIRAGIEFTDKMPTRTPCKACGFPFGDDDLGGKCRYCASIRKCTRCARIFPARFPWLKTAHCDPCRMRLESLSQSTRPRRLLAPNKGGDE